jgi:hypothetical protein
MNTKPAAPVIFTVSLVVLIGGGAGTAAWGGPVQDDRTATVVGLARGDVVVRDDLSPTRGADPIRAIERSGTQANAFSADALRELHSRSVVPQAVPGFTADALRELHSQGVAPKSDRAYSAEARREMHSQSTPVQPAQDGLSADAIREMKSGAPQGGSVDDVLSPIAGDR